MIPGAPSLSFDRPCPTQVAVIDKIGAMDEIGRLIRLIKTPVSISSPRRIHLISGATCTYQGACRGEAGDCQGPKPPHC